MGIRLEKAWMDLNAATIASLPAQLGVYQVADSQGTVLSVGYAGARHLFGAHSKKNFIYMVIAQRNFVLNSLRTTEVVGMSF